MDKGKLTALCATALCCATPAFAATDLDALKRTASLEVERRQDLVQQIVDQLFSYSEQLGIRYPTVRE